MPAVLSTSTREPLFVFCSRAGAVLILVLALMAAQPATAQELIVGSLGDETTISESDAGLFLAAFRVLLQPTSTEVVTVTFATADGTATAGEDYVAIPPVTLTFNPGDFLQTIAVHILDDDIDELDETYFAVISDPVGATLGTSQTTGTVLDDDPTVLRVGDVTVEEGDTARVQIVMSTPQTMPVTVDMDTGDGTAIDGVDYVGGSAALTFSPGDDVLEVAVLTIDDDEVEVAEDFLIQLSNASGAVIDDSEGRVTIRDDEGAIFADGFDSGTLSSWDAVAQ